MFVKKKKMFGSNIHILPKIPKSNGVFFKFVLFHFRFRFICMLLCPVKIRIMRKFLLSIYRITWIDIVCFLCSLCNRGSRFSQVKNRHTEFDIPKTEPVPSNFSFSVLGIHSVCTQTSETTLLSSTILLA